MKDAWEDKEELPLVNNSLVDTLDSQRIFDIERYKGGFYVENSYDNSYQAFLTIDEMRKLGQELIDRANAYALYLDKQEIMTDENLSALDNEEDEDDQN